MIKTKKSPDSCVSALTGQLEQREQSGILLCALRRRRGKARDTKWYETCVCVCVDV